MFDRHVTRKLLARLHGELHPQESRLVDEHLSGCERCRRELEEIKLAVTLAGQLPQAAAPQSLWSEIETLLDDARQPAARKRPGFLSSVPRLAMTSAAILLLIAVSASLYFVYRTKASWEIERLAIDRESGVERVIAIDRLASGDSIETSRDSQIRIKIGLIGEVLLDPNSRVRLIEASITEHRIALDRGRMSAKISAPPRLFFVDTPSAQAIDLGCEYTLEVDDDGSSLLHVTLGEVALEWKGREVVVPRYGKCETRPGQGAGTPYFETASLALIDALARFDFENGGDPALETVMKESTDRDTFTLWNLLSRVSESQRGRLFDRMVQLVGLPAGITRQGVIELNPEMLRLWEEELDTTWF